MTRYQHIRNGNKPIGTIAYEVKDGRLYVGTAFVSKKDQFARSKGRIIAEGRMSKPKVQATFGDVIHDYSAIIDNLPEGHKPVIRATKNARGVQITVE